MLYSVVYMFNIKRHIDNTVDRKVLKDNWLFLWVPDEPGTSVATSHMTVLCSELFILCMSLLITTNYSYGLSVLFFSTKNHRCRWSYPLNQVKKARPKKPK